MSRLLPTQEIGSLSKPLWRLKALGRTGRPAPEDVEAARRLGQALGVEGVDDLVALLSKPRLAAADKDALRRFSSLTALRLLEHLRLDWVYDGEQLRTEMYDEALRNLTNVERRGWVRSFDNRYYVKQAFVGPPGLTRPYHLDEFRWLASVARRPLKVPITGPYTLLDWSFDETGDGPLFGRAGRTRKAEARRTLGLRLARDVIRPNLQALIDAGARRIQIDAPAATTVPEEVPLFVELFNAAVEGLTAEFSIHICFSDYGLLLPHILDLKGCTEFALEFANDDAWTRGKGRDHRPGYRTLELLAEHGVAQRIGLGVVDIHTDRLEPTDLIVDRIEHAARVLGDPARLAVNPDCGLRTRSWDVARTKLSRIVEAAGQVRAQWGQEAAAPPPRAA